MDIIEHLQDYKNLLVHITNNEIDYHKASKTSFLLDKVDNLISSIIEFRDQK